MPMWHVGFCGASQGLYFLKQNTGLVFAILLLNRELVLVPLGLGSSVLWLESDTVFSFKWSLDDAMVVSLGETGASAPAVRNHFWNVAGQRCCF